MEPVAATVDRVLAQEDQRGELNSADHIVRRLGFAWGLGRDKACTHRTRARGTLHFAKVPQDFQAPSTHAAIIRLGFLLGT